MSLPRSPIRLLSAVLLPLLGAPSLAQAADAGAACEVLPWAEEAAAGRIEAIPAGVAETFDTGTRIGAVELQREQIFDVSDPSEDNPLYRFANGAHILTREHAIREQVPFLATGEELVPLELVEAERILRRLDWLYDARVVPVRRCGDEVDLVVVTRDVWTILPSVSLDRSGGESSFSFGVEDENLLGRGETLGVVYEDDVDRSGVAVYYSDPSVVGTPWRLDLYAADNDDGHRFDVNLRHPFRSLDERSSRGGRVTVDERVQPLFDAGFRAAEFRMRSRSATLFVARSTGRVEGFVRRWTLGLAYFDHEFAREPGPLQPAQLPDDRRALYPYVAFERIEDDFLPLSNMGLIGRAQDIHLGRRLSGSLGLSPDAFGADDGRMLFRLDWRDALQPRDAIILTGFAGANGAVTTGDGEAENLYVSAGGSLDWLQTDALRFHASIDATWTRGLTVDNQLQLGGENGLRAYPQRFQQGDRRLRARIEERWYAPHEPLRLFRYGAAVYVDAGRAWFPGDPDGDAEEGWLANVGVGLRLMPTRLPTSSMIHIDLAAPLRTGGRDVDDVQLSVTLRRGF